MQPQAAFAFADVKAVAEEFQSAYVGTFVYDNLKRGQIIIKKGATVDVAKLAK